MKKLPAMLVLPDYTTKSILKELVQTRKRMLMVQAVSQFRQKRMNEAVGSLQNLLSCARALPEKEPMAWREKAELKELFSAYCAWEAKHGKRAELQALLGLDDDEALELGSASESDEGQKVKAMEGEDSFF